MTIEYACRLLKKETSAEEIAKLEYYNGFNRQKTVDEINQAIDLICETAMKYEDLLK